MSKTKIFLILLVIGTAFWGISFPLSKEAYASITPYTFMFYRFLIAAIALAIIFYRQILSINKSTLKKGIISGIFLFMGICWQAVGLKYTSASNASFIAGIEVVMIPLFAFFIMKKSIQPKIWAACILAVGGLYTIAMSSGLSNFKIGDLMVFIGSIFYSTYVLYVGKISQEKQSSESKLDPKALVIMQLFVCAIASGIVTIVQGGLSSIALPMSAKIWESLLFVGIFSTGYMYCIQNIAQKYIAPEKIALTYLCEPIFATIFAYFMLNEAITPTTVVGGTLILISMFISEANIPKLFRSLQKIAIPIKVKDRN